MKDGKKVILYVDDDVDFRDSMRTVIEAEGYLMIEAATGEEGIHLYNEELPDLVIVDLMMEEIDSGTKMVRDLNSSGCQVPIIVASSVGDALSMTADYEELGLSGVLQKPVDFDTLIALLKSKLK